MNYNKHKSNKTEPMTKCKYYTQLSSWIILRHTNRSMTKMPHFVYKLITCTNFLKVIDICWREWKGTFLFYIQTRGRKELRDKNPNKQLWTHSSIAFLSYCLSSQSQFCSHHNQKPKTFPLLSNHTEPNIYRHVTLQSPHTYCILPTLRLT